MTIFIKGKTACRICGQVLTSSAGMVGFPNIGMPNVIGELADSCLHRACLDAHPQREELLHAWKLHWVAQTERAGVKTLTNQHGMVIFDTRRFRFAALESFIELEDQVEVFDQLRAFFVTFDGREQLSSVTTWNTYELMQSPQGARLLVTSNSVPVTTLRVMQEGAILDYEFTADRWSCFASAWADFDMTSK